MSDVPGIEIVERIPAEIIKRAAKIIKAQSTLPSSGIAFERGEQVVSLPQAFADAVLFSRDKSVVTGRQITSQLCAKFLGNIGLSAESVKKRERIEQTFGHVFDCLHWEGFVENERDPIWFYMIGKNWEISTASSQGTEKVAKACSCLDQMIH